MPSIVEGAKAAGIKGTYTRLRPTYAGYHRIVADGSGGVFVIWNEEGTGGESRIYVQRLNADVKAVLLENSSVGEGLLQSAESDGEGGVIIRTRETAGLEIHVNAEGELLEIKGYDSSKLIISDGTGGSFSIRIEEDLLTGIPGKDSIFPG